MAKIAIEIHDGTVHLTADEARQLYEELRAIFAPPVHAVPLAAPRATITWGSVNAFNTDFFATPKEQHE